MTEFDYKKVVSETAEDDPETKEIKEDHLKHIEEISKHLSGPKTVLEVKRIHEGEVTVLGTIVSASEMYVVEDGPLEYRDAKAIQLEDTERPDENERLDVVLYDDMISNVLAGEVVEITGVNRIESKRGSKSKKKTTVLHADSIKYLNRKELVITDTDINNFQKFAKFPKLIERLVSMFAPNIIEHNDAKLGILRSVVGGIERGKIRGRINTFMVGDPGTAKSTLAREAVDVKPNSRYVSGPHSRVKTITAIMDKDNDGLVLRLGAIPLSRGAICAVNEVTAFSIEEQAHLLDVAEEGIIPLNKHGTHMIIPSPTTIIATANPIQSTWNDNQKVSNDEISILKTLLDRFDQIYPFRDSMDLKQTYEFVQKMSAIRKRRPHNYNFLKKYLIYASTIEVKISPEAEFMLNEFWIRAKVQKTLTIRGYNSLFRIAEAQAKLQLKNEVDAEIAKQTMESVQLMMVQYGETVQLVNNPRETTHSKFLEILEDTAGPVDIKELCEMACRRDVQVRNYLGTNWSQRHNWKLRTVIDMLLNHDKVKQVSTRPLILQWTRCEM